MKHFLLDVSVHTGVTVASLLRYRAGGGEGKTGHITRCMKVIRELASQYIIGEIQKIRAKTSPSYQLRSFSLMRTVVDSSGIIAVSCWP